jgi:hypothetical protein
MIKYKFKVTSVKSIAKSLESGYDCDSDFSLVKAFGLVQNEIDNQSRLRRCI